MKRILFAAAALMLAAPSSFAASNQTAVNECIEAWGKASPFKVGTPPGKVITGGVKVFGIGGGNHGNDPATATPSLILVSPAVNVLGKSTLRLSNPKGWYCFKSNVTVLGKITVEAHCNAHLASARQDGKSVMAADESNKSVAVLGALRVNRYECSEKRK